MWQVCRSISGGGEKKAGEPRALSTELNCAVQISIPGHVLVMYKYCTQYVEYAPPLPSDLLSERLLLEEYCSVHSTAFHAAQPDLWRL